MQQQIAGVVVRAKGVDEGHIIFDPRVGGGHQGEGGPHAEPTHPNPVLVHEVPLFQVLESPYQVLDLVGVDVVLQGHHGGPVEHGHEPGPGQGITQVHHVLVVAPGGVCAQEDQHRRPLLVVGDAVEVGDTRPLGLRIGYCLAHRVGGEPGLGLNG